MMITQHYQLIDRHNDSSILADLDMTPLVEKITPFTGAMTGLLPEQPFVVDVPYKDILVDLHEVETILQQKRVEIPQPAPVIAPRFEQVTRMNVVGGVLPEDRQYTITPFASMSNSEGRLVESYFVQVPVVERAAPVEPQEDPNAALDEALLALNAIETFFTTGEDHNAIVKHLD